MKHCIAFARQQPTSPQFSKGGTNVVTASWELWKHPNSAPGGRPMFFKAKLPKESKNGFKTISCRRYPVMFFSKNYFWHQKSSKQLDVLLIFEFLCQYKWINKTSFNKFNCRTFRISWNTTKILKTDQFFNMGLFIFEN